MANERLGIFEELQAKGAKYIRPPHVVHRTEFVRRPVVVAPRPPVVVHPIPYESKAFAVRAAVARAADISVADVRSAGNSRRYARPRQLGMAIIHKLLKLSQPDTGSVFGDRDHTTVLAGYRRAKQLLDTNRDFQKLYERTHELLARQWPDFPKFDYQPLPESIGVLDIVAIVAKHSGVSTEDILRILPSPKGRLAYMASLTLSYEFVDPQPTRHVIAHIFGRKLTGVFQLGAPRIAARVKEMHGGPELVAKCRDDIARWPNHQTEEQREAA